MNGSNGEIPLNLSITHPVENAQSTDVTISAGHVMEMEYKDANDIVYLILLVITWIQQLMVITSMSPQYTITLMQMHASVGLWNESSATSTLRN